MRPAVFRPSSLNGTVTVPASKSVVHRMMIAAALSDAPTEVLGRIEGKDTEATAKCLTALGAKTERRGSGFSVSPLNCQTAAVAEAGESGSTLRFLVPVAASLGTQTEFKTEGRLSERPIKELAEAMRKHGAEVSVSGRSFFVKGKLRSGKFDIDGTVSSQYITGLLFALPGLSGDSEIIVRGKAVSENYINITLDVLSRFGIIIEKTAHGFYIEGGQTFRTPGKIVSEGDWSSAAFFAVGAALSGKVTLENLIPDSAQGDKAVVDILKDMGADISETETGLTVAKRELKACSFNAENCPDLVPVTAVAAAAADGVSEISGVSRLKIKESDRLSAIIKNLSALGIKSETDGETLKIFGGKIKGGEALSFGDHRMAMSAAVAATAAEGGIRVDDVDCTAKSYPSFLEDYKATGGRYEII